MEWHIFYLSLYHFDYLLFFVISSLLFSSLPGSSLIQWLEWHRFFPSCCNGFASSSSFFLFFLIHLNCHSFRSIYAWRVITDVLNVLTNKQPHTHTPTHLYIFQVFLKPLFSISLCTCVCIYNILNTFVICRNVFYNSLFSVFSELAGHIKNQHETSMIVNCVNTDANANANVGKWKKEEKNTRE